MHTFSFSGSVAHCSFSSSLNRIHFGLELIGVHQLLLMASIFFDPDHPALNQPDGKTVVRSVSAWITTSAILIRIQESSTANAATPARFTAPAITPTIRNKKGIHH
jgi:hypothetical protein